MKLVKAYHGWGIFSNNSEEVEKYGYYITVLDPIKFGTGIGYTASPEDGFIECNSVSEAIGSIDELSSYCCM